MLNIRFWWKKPTYLKISFYNDIFENYLFYSYIFIKLNFHLKAILFLFGCWLAQSSQYNKTNKLKIIIIHRKSFSWKTNYKGT